MSQEEEESKEIAPRIGFHSLTGDVLDAIYEFLNDPEEEENSQSLPKFVFVSK